MCCIFDAKTLSSIAIKQMAWNKSSFVTPSGAKTSSQGNCSWVKTIIIIFLREWYFIQENRYHIVLLNHRRHPERRKSQNQVVDLSQFTVHKGILKKRWEQKKKRCNHSVKKKMKKKRENTINNRKFLLVFCLLDGAQLKLNCFQWPRW